MESLHLVMQNRDRQLIMYTPLLQQTMKPPLIPQTAAWAFSIAISWSHQQTLAWGAQMQHGGEGSTLKSAAAMQDKDRQLFLYPTAAAGHDAAGEMDLTAAMVSAVAILAC